VAATLEGKRAVVTGADRDPGTGLGDALHGAGADVGRVPTAVYSSLEAARESFASAQDGMPAAPIDILVHTAMPPVAFEPADLVDVDDARWDAVWEGAMQTMLFAFQAAYTDMRGRGGSIILLTPTVSMSGAARLVPYATAVEGQRVLAKAAARQWGADGIRVNCLAPAPEHLPIGVASMTVSLAAPALGGPGDTVRDLGPIAAWLASDDAHFVTGNTICADGGVWMMP
jgi:3-oxoacyl-[acyl-carrier protein] reductase